MLCLGEGMHLLQSPLSPPLMVGDGTATERGDLIRNLGELNGKAFLEAVTDALEEEEKEQQEDEEGEEEFNGDSFETAWVEDDEAESFSGTVVGLDMDFTEGL